MPISEAAAALHHPALGPNDEFGIELVLIAVGEFEFVLGFLPDDSEAFFNFKPVPNALRNGAAKAFAEGVLFVRD